MRTSLAFTRIFTLFAIFVILIACNIPLIPNPGLTDSTTPITPAFTFTIQPIDEPEKGVTETPTITATNTPVIETETFTPTYTIIPPSVTNTQVSLPCNQAQFVGDVNYADGTQVTKNTDFIKTWRLKNSGSCSWTSEYNIIFETGDRMGAPDETNLTNGSIPPGALVDISVQLKAPSSPGTYQGYFRLKSADNVVFGINGAANDAFWVQISVPGSILILPNLIPGFKISTSTPTPIFKKPFIVVTLHNFP
jgi:hypothetical protein